MAQRTPRKKPKRIPPPAPRVAVVYQDKWPPRPLFMRDMIVKETTK
jgi:hypothetical protein